MSISHLINLPLIFILIFENADLIYNNNNNINI